MRLFFVTTKPLLINKTFLKIVALFCGWSIWHILSDTQQKKISIPVTLLFSTTNTTPENSIETPKDVTVLIQGRRSSLRRFLGKSRAITIPTESLSEGTSEIHLTASLLLLPEGCNLLSYTPSPLLVTKKTL